MKKVLTLYLHQTLSMNRRKNPPIKALVIRIWYVRYFILQILVWICLKNQKQNNHPVLALHLVMLLSLVVRVFFLNHSPCNEIYVLNIVYFHLVLIMG